MQKTLIAVVLAAVSGVLASILMRFLGVEGDMVKAVVCGVVGGNVAVMVLRKKDA